MVSKITADGDWSHEIKRHLLLGRKAMTNLDSILKSRDITFPTKVHLVIVMVFPVVMYECENWTLKKTKHWRIDAFELWCWRRFDSPLFCKIKPVNPKGNQSWIFIGRTDTEIVTPILWLPDAKSPLIRKVPDAGKVEGRKRRGWQRMRWLNGITDSWTWVWESPGRWWRPGKPGMLQSWDHKKLDMTEQLNKSNLLKRLSFLHCICLPPLSKIRCP